MYHLLNNQARILFDKKLYKKVSLHTRVVNTQADIKQTSNKPTAIGWTKRFAALFCSIVFSLSAYSNKPEVSSSARLLTLSETINLAQQNDDWLLKSQSLEQGLQALGEGAMALPDPILSVSVLNLPSNGFDFNQEPMTQLKVGASQLFPRGNTLDLQKQKYQISALEQPYLRRDRKGKVALKTELFWLEAYHAQASYTLVEETRPLFDKLQEIVSASYASSYSSASQQDIIRSELELMRLSDRLISLRAQKKVALEKLSSYLFDSARTYGLHDSRHNSYKTGYEPSAYESTSSLSNSRSMPNKTAKPNATSQVLDELHSIDWSSQSNIALPLALNAISPEDATRLSQLQTLGKHELYQVLSQHPLMLASEQRVKAFEVDTKIAEESLKPQYGVNASYAFRDDTPMGQSRADFFSVGLTMSLPLFSSTKQDAQISNSIHMKHAAKTDKLILARDLLAAVKSAYAEYVGLSERYAIYANKIIPQMAQQSEATLNAYTNDTGDFAEVVRSKIAQLDAQLTLLSVQVAQHKALATIRYYLPLSKLRQEQDSLSRTALSEDLVENSPINVNILQPSGVYSK